MKKNKQSKWFALVIFLCISLGAKAQMPQTPQDILNMAAGSLQFDFSGYFNGQQKQQQQQQQYQQQQPQQQQMQKVQCRACNGRGRLEGHNYTPGSADMQWPYCSECGTTRPPGHYHYNCPGCHGTGYVYGYY